MTNTESPQELLCRWIYHSGNKETSDRHFTAYYNTVAGPGKALPNRCHRLSKSLAEELLQEAFHDFVVFIKNRPKAAIRILQRTTRLGLPAKGEFFHRQTRKWAEDSESLTRRIMVFCAENCGNSPASASLHGRTLLINGELPPLLIRGAELLSWAMTQHDGDIQSNDNEEPPTGQDEEQPETAESYLRDEVNRLLKRIIKWLENSEKYADEKLGANGGTVFAQDTIHILNDLPKLTIPFTALLFRLAKNHLATKFRSADAFAKGILVAVEDDDEGNDVPPDPDVVEKTSFEPDPIVDGAIQRASEASEQFWELVRNTLEAPVRDADTHFRNAKTKGEKTKAAIALEKRQDDSAELAYLLELWLQETSISDIARAMDLDRKTVRKRLNELWTQLAPLMNI